MGLHELQSKSFNEGAFEKENVQRHNYLTFRDKTIPLRSSTEESTRTNNTFFHKKLRQMGNSKILESSRTSHNNMLCESTISQR